MSTSSLTVEQLLTLAGENPEEAKREAERRLRDGQWGDSVLLLQTLGVAERNLRNPRASVDHLTRALEVHGEAGDPNREWLLRVDVAASLADLGDPEQGLLVLGGDGGPDQQILESMADTPLARTEHGRGLMLQRIGRLGPAWQAYVRARDVYERIGHHLGVGQINANLSVLATHQGLIDEALALSVAAEEAYTSAGNDWWVAHTILNRGWTYGCSGNIPKALELLSQAEHRFLAMGIPDGLRLVTRAEVLLRAGLYDAARTDLLKAVDEFDRSDLGIDAAEALILAAESAEMAEDVTEAIRLAETAVDRLRDQNRPGWAAAAVATAFAIRCRSRIYDGDIQSDVERIADDLRAAGKQPSIPTVRLSAALALLEQGNKWAAEQQIELVDSGAMTRDGRALAALVTARLHEVNDDLDRALGALDQGFTNLQDELQLFGGVDIAAMAAAAVVRVVDQAKRLLATSTRSEDYLLWADRGRQIATWRWPRIYDEELEQLLKQARALALGGASGRSEADDRALVALRKNIEELRWQQHRQLDPIKQDFSVRPKWSTTLIDISEVDERWVVVLADGGHVTHHIVDVDRSSVQALVRLGRLYQTSPPSMQRQMMDQMRSSAAVIDELISERLPRDHEQPVLIGIDESLLDIPWSILRSLWERPYSILPTHRYLADRSRAVSTAEGVSVLVGPGLASGAAEVHSIARADEVGPAPADFESLASALDRRIVHIAAHGGPEPNNPLFNWLEFEFGRVFLHDLMFVDIAPETVVLAACYAGQSQRFGAGGSGSFANGFLGVGSRWVVSASTALRDDPHMIEFAAAVVNEIARGVDAPTALARVRRAQASPTSNPAAIAFTCYGG